MDARSERGEGKLAQVIWLAVAAVVIYGGWNVVPLYIDNFSLNDTVNTIARTPRGSMKDDAILAMIMKEVRERRLDGWIESSCWHISTLDTSRRITCEYDRDAKILPGMNHTFHFKVDVDQPLIF